MVNKIHTKRALVFVTARLETVNDSVEELEELGFEITVVRDGNRAVHIADYKAKMWKPSLFIIDVVLPQMSGFELTRRVLAKYSDGKVPVILMAEHIAPADKLEGEQAGALAVIQKPVTWKALSEVLEKKKKRKVRHQQLESGFKINY